MTFSEDALGALGFVSGLLPTVTIIAGMGIGAGYLGVVLMAWLQERTKPSMHGRVMSLMMCSPRSPSIRSRTP